VHDPPDESETAERVVQITIETIAPEKAFAAARVNQAAIGPADSHHG
jgi:hypothetical protein